MDAPTIASERFASRFKNWLLVDESYDRAEDLLVDNRVLLDKLAGELIEHETVDARHLVRLIEEYAVGSEAPQRVGTTTLGKESR